MRSQSSHRPCLALSTSESGLGAQALCSGTKGSLYSRSALEGPLNLRFFLISQVPDCPQTGLVPLQFTLNTGKALDAMGTAINQLFLLQPISLYIQNVHISVSCRSPTLPSKEMLLHALRHSDQEPHCPPPFSLANSPLARPHSVAPRFERMDTH